MSKAQTLYNSIKQSNLNAVQSFFDLEYFDNGKWKTLLNQRFDINDVVFDVNEFEIIRDDNTLSFGRLMLKYMINRSNFNEQLFLSVTNLNRVYRVRYGLYNLDSKAVVDSESILLSFFYNTLQVEKDYITVESNYTGHVKQVLDFNNTLVLGNELLKRITSKKNDGEYFYLENVLNSISELLDPVIKITWVFEPLENRMSYNNYNLFSLRQYPVDVKKFMQLLNNNISISQLLTDISKTSPFFTEPIIFEFIDDDQTLISINTYANKTSNTTQLKSPFKIRYGDVNSIISNLTVTNGVNFRTFQNQNIINTLTKDYREKNNIDFYQIKKELRDDYRLKLDILNTSDIEILKNLIQNKFNGSITVDELKLAANNVGKYPDKNWYQMYGQCSIIFGFPVLYLRVADIVELSGVIQTTEGRKTGLYYITSVRYFSEQNKIQTELNLSLVEFI